MMSGDRQMGGHEAQDGSKMDQCPRLDESLMAQMTGQQQGGDATHNHAWMDENMGPRPRLIEEHKRAYY